MNAVWFSPHTLDQLTMMLLAFLLSAAIGLERRRALKSAGLRTHTLVGLGSTVFTLVSVYGFEGALGSESIADPSRIAAQIVSGIGFLGAGLIFVRRSTVSGLTTAASIWTVAAIGMACGAGQPLLAIMATALQLIAVMLLGRVGHLLRAADERTQVIVRYRPKRDALHLLTMIATEHGLPTTILSTEYVKRSDKPNFFVTRVLVHEPASALDRFLHELSAVPGVKSVQIPDAEDGSALQR